MCITIIKRKTVTVVLLWLAVFASQYVCAQSHSTLINPMKKTDRIEDKFEVSLYIGAAIFEPTAFSFRDYFYFSNGYNKPYHICMNDVDIGLNGYYVIGDISGFNFSAGYKNVRYAGNHSYDRSEGVFVNMLALDMNMCFWFFMVGLHSDIFLDYNAKNGNYIYDGIYEDCFNKASFSWYIGCFLRFTRLQLDFRLGPYLYPNLNADKIAQYNLTRVYVDMFYYTIRLSYRIFTTGNPIQSPINYFK